MPSLLLYVPFYSIFSFLPFARAHCFHYNIAYGHGGPPNLTPEAGKRVQRGAERGCAPATGRGDLWELQYYSETKSTLRFV